MQASIKKARHIYLPFLAIAVAFIVVYTFLNWIFFVRANRFPIREDFFNFWFPMVLPWIPVLIWLRPRIRLLKLKGAHGHLPFIYLFTAVWAIAIPTIIAQTYIEKASGKLTELETINDIGKYKRSKYYSLKEFDVDMMNLGSHASCIVSKTRQYVDMHVYYVLPIIGSSSDLSKSCIAWMAIEYSRRISNKLKIDEQRKKYSAFLTESKKELGRNSLKSFTYLERIKYPQDFAGFKQAIKKSPKLASKKTPVLRAMNQPFEKRTGNAFDWIIAAFAIGSGIWLIMVLIPKFAGNYPDAESYVIKHPESVVLEAINSFKNANPQHLRPQYLNLIDGRNKKDQHDQCYHLYFFYPEDYQIVYAWTRPIDPISTEIALIAISEGLIFGNWKDINKDFIGHDNDIHKEKFIGNILDKITEHIECNIKAS